MGIAADLMTGTELQDRFNEDMRLARAVHERACFQGIKSVIADVSTPPKASDKEWVMKSSRLWRPPVGRYMVGYDLNDPEHTIRIYRRKRGDVEPGGVINRTYDVYVTTVWQDSELDRLEQSLLAIIA